MRCQNCSAENPEGAKFCIQCATALRRRCPKCRCENPPAARFCAECATALTGDQVGQPAIAAGGPAPSPIRVTPENADASLAIHGERKTVPPLSPAIQASTQLAQHLDPSEA